MWLRSLSREQGGEAWGRLLGGLGEQYAEPSGRGSARRVVPEGLFYSRAAPPKREELFNNGFDFPSETLFDRVARDLQDGFRRVKLLQRSIAEAGGQVDDASDAYTGEELFHGRVAEALNDFRAEYVDPLIEQMAGHEVTLDELDEYLYACHVREPTDYIASIRADMPGAVSLRTRNASSHSCALRTALVDVYAKAN